MSVSKIIPLRYLYRWAGAILTHGCFDLVHLGHIRYLKWAKRLDESLPLVVTLTSDEHFPNYKGEGRPVFNESERAEWLAALDVVDIVSIVYDRTAVPAIEVLKPSYYVKGHEAEGMIPEEQGATESVGGKVVFMPAESKKGQIYSSGKILSGQLLRNRIVQQKWEGGEYGWE